LRQNGRNQTRAQAGGWADCGACEPACPVTAIFAEDDVPDNEKPYIEINALWYRDKEAARNQVMELV
jgi:ferredoxin